MKKRLTMFLAALFLTMGTALAQTKVSGTVLSQEDGQPIIGAAVKVDGTSTGMLTDVNGRFSLAMPAGSKTITVSYRRSPRRGDCRGLWYAEEVFVYWFCCYREG